MLGEVLGAILIGVLFGILTGLIPGIHINLVAVVLLTLSPFLLEITTPMVLVCFILSMSITHTFTDFIASVYLGAPDDDTALSALPAHKLLLQGHAIDAIRLSIIGSIGGLIFTLLLLPLLIVVVPVIFELARPYIGIGLLAIVLFMIFRETSVQRKAWATLVFLSSGILGLIVLTDHTIQDPLFVLLSGLFGVSMLVHSLSQQVNIPSQHLKESITIPFKTSCKACTAGTLAGSLLSIFPGLGPAQAAILGSQVYKKITDHDYLILVGAINTVVMVMSLVTLFTIDKARNGSIVAVQELVSLYDLNWLWLSIGVCLVSGGIAAILTMNLGKACSKFLSKVNYTLLSISIIVFIFVLGYYFNGLMGIFILTLSTAIGLIPVLTIVGRNHAMGVLLLPVTLYFLM